ncbi:MAG: immunity 70 family protein [Gammaproteobacteria bacterium]|nr:immunity 70 family protein [Gammaproteobacteria bacterium]
MGVGLRVGNITTEVGTGDFLHAFFSTVSFHLERDGWGSRFPELFNELYQGDLPPEHCDKVLADLETIKSELASLEPGQVVWDIDNLEAQPPWGDHISEEITSLANYFVTSGGRDLFEVLIECLEYQVSQSVNMTIAQTPPRRIDQHKGATFELSVKGKDTGKE